LAGIKKGLGSKGLGIEALINTKMEDFHETGKEQGVLEIDINKIEPNKEQPRRIFQEDALMELAESLKTYGVIQPIVVKKQKDYYQIIAGERRFRAAKIAGLKTIPAIVKDMEKDAAFEVALVENLQRQDLNPLEEAESYRRLQEEFGLSQEEIAQKVGKSRSAITNSLRLLNLDPRIRTFLAEKKLAEGHARALLPLADGDAQFELAEKIIEDDLSVRMVEALVKQEMEKKESPEKKIVEEKETLKQAAYHSIENELKSIFSTKVKLSSKKNKGKIEIEYYSDEDLDRILSIIKSGDRI
jgi:ParB family chromosome partitioning protein